MYPLILLSIGGLLLSVGDVIFRFWVDKPSYLSPLYIGGLTFWLMGNMLLAESIKTENIAIATAILVIVNIVVITLISRFYFGDSISTLQIIGLVLACIAIFLLEIA